MFAVLGVVLQLVPDNFVFVRSSTNRDCGGSRVKIYVKSQLLVGASGFSADGLPWVWDETAKARRHVEAHGLKSCTRKPENGSDHLTRQFHKGQREITRVLNRKSSRPVSNIAFNNRDHFPPSLSGAPLRRLEWHTLQESGGTFVHV